MLAHLLPLAQASYAVSDEEVAMRTERWRREEAPLSSRIVADEAGISLRRQRDTLQGYDLKASFLTATAGALLAGLVAANHWPTNAHAEDALGVSVIALVVALLAAVFVWVPRMFNGDPHPSALYPAMFYDFEENVLMRLAERRKQAFEDNIRVLRRKMWGLRIGAGSLGIAIVLGGVSFVVH